MYWALKLNIKVSVCPLLHGHLWTLSSYQLACHINLVLSSSKPQLFNCTLESRISKYAKSFTNTCHHLFLCIQKNGGWGRGKEKEMATRERWPASVLRTLQTGPRMKTPPIPRKKRHNIRTALPTFQYTELSRQVPPYGSQTWGQEVSPFSKPPVKTYIRSLLFSQKATCILGCLFMRHSGL